MYLSNLVSFSRDEMFRRERERESTGLIVTQDLFPAT